MEYLVVLVTIDNKEKAKQIARRLIEEKLAVCANILQVDSIYRWKGKIEEEGEYGVIFKSNKEVYKKLEERIKELHSYEVPEVLAFDISAGNQSYLTWLSENLKER